MIKVYEAKTNKTRKLNYNKAYKSKLLYNERTEDIKVQRKGKLVTT